MKAIILSLSLLFCTYSINGQSLMQNACAIILPSLDQTISPRVVIGQLPTLPSDASQITNWMNDGSLGVFLASDLFAVIGVIAAIITGILWFLYFSNAFRLASNERDTLF